MSVGVILSEQAQIHTSWIVLEDLMVRGPHWIIIAPPLGSPNELCYPLATNQQFPLFINILH